MLIKKSLIHKVLYWKKNKTAEVVVLEMNMVSEEAKEAFKKQYDLMDTYMLALKGIVEDNVKNAAHISKIMWKIGKKRDYENRISEKTVFKREK